MYLYASISKVFSRDRIIGVLLAYFSITIILKQVYNTLKCNNFHVASSNKNRSIITNVYWYHFYSVPRLRTHEYNYITEPLIASFEMTRLPIHLIDSSSLYIMNPNECRFPLVQQLKPERKQHCGHLRVSLNQTVSQQYF